jgi:integrase
MSAVLKASGMPLKMRRPKEPEGRVRWLSPEEAQTLLDCCAPHLRPIVAFLLATGARIGEALYLDWRCVDLERAHVTFPKTKNGKPRGVYLKPEIVAMLANMPHRKGEVFRRRDGKPYTRQDPDDEMNRSGARRIKTGFDGACRRAGIEDFHPHDCRHTWATWHYEKNRDLIGLMHDGGWQSLRMVQRYAHVNLEHRRAAFEALPKLKIG